MPLPLCVREFQSLLEVGLQPPPPSCGSRAEEVKDAQIKRYWKSREDRTSPIAGSNSIASTVVTRWMFGCLSGLDLVSHRDLIFTSIMSSASIQFIADKDQKTHDLDSAEQSQHTTNMIVAVQ